MLNQRRPSLSPGRALLIAAFCWVIAALITGATFTGHLIVFDRSGLLMWRDLSLLPKHFHILAEPVRDITALGGVLLRNLFALIFVITLIFLRFRSDAVFFVVAIISGWIVNSYLKMIFARPRPDIVPHIMDAGGYSFPSGHSFNGAVVYLAASLIITVHTKHAWARKAVVFGAVVLSGSIAWSRVWLGVHWPSDVIAGWLFGAGWAFFISALFYRTPHR